MTYSTKNNSRKVNIIILIITLLVMLIGSSFAYYSLVLSQKKEGTKLYTGKLEIHYIDGVYINNPKLVPMSEPDYDTYKNVYRNNFTITSSGTLNQTISIDLETTQNDFPDGTIKYILYNSRGDKIAKGNVASINNKTNLVSNLYLAYNGSAKYTLMLWYNDTGYNQNNEMGYKMYGKINVYSRQVKY